jgi:signal transduction histidine kinase
MAKWRWTPMIAITASLALAVIAISAFVAISASSRDAAQRMIEERIVAAAVRDSLAKLGDALAPNAYWDVAYDEITTSIGPVWAQQNLGPYAAQTSGVSAVLIFDDAGNLIYNYFPSDRLHVHEFDHRSADAISALVKQARKELGVPPAAATAFVPIADKLYLGAASLIVPSDERARVPLARHNVEVYLRPFDASNLAKVQDDFRVSKITLAATTPNNGMAQTALNGAAGRPAAFLVWQASTPGKDFALSILPWALGVVLLIGILQVLALHGWMEAVSTLERKKAETAQLKQEVWNRTMFLANMSHELKTPLNAIIGFSDVIKRQMFGELSERYREYAADINSSGRHLLGIVDDVLDLTKLQHTEQIELEPVKLDSTLETAMSILRQQAERSGIALNVNRLGADIKVLGNEKSLNQIVINLGSNAIKFSRPGSRVDISFDQAPAGESVSITVRDEGCGIPAEKLPILGRPFYQVQSSYSRKSGTGLGLAITKTLVEKMNGDLKLDSKVGVGTTAVVTLRAA